MTFEPAPALPAWLEAEFPFRRRIYRGADHAIHFVDEGQGPAVVLQHGNPTWSFLWRKVIRRLLEHPVRVVAPDLVGLGLSDKPRDARVHTLAFHAAQIEGLIQALALNRVAIVGQDWGGPILALVAARNPDRVTGAMFANTGLAAPRRAQPLSWFHRLANLPLVSDLAFRVLGFPLPVLDRVQGDRRSIGVLQKTRLPLPAAGDTRSCGAPGAGTNGAGQPGPPQRGELAASRGVGAVVPRPGAPGMGNARSDPGQGA